MSDLKMIDVKIAAQHIATAAHTAYWLESLGSGSAAHHVAEVHREVRQIAEALGYDLTPKAPAPALMDDEAAQ